MYSKPYTHEDKERLPEGMRRVSYDADTSQYTFTDAQGQAYTGPPGSTYGVLKPVPDPYTQVLQERPEAFADTEVEAHPSTLAQYESRDPTYAPKTFQDFLPPSLLTATQSAPDDKPPSRFSRHKSSASQSSTHSHSRSMSNASSAPGAYPGSYGAGTGEEASPKKSNRFKIAGMVSSLKRSVTNTTKKQGNLVPEPTFGHARHRSEGKYEVLKEEQEGGWGNSARRN